MKKALGKKELLGIVPLSMSTIDRLEHENDFPKRFWLTDKRCAWNADEVEAWLDARQVNSPEGFAGKKPPVSLRGYRQVRKVA